MKYFMAVGTLCVFVCYSAHSDIVKVSGVSWRYRVKDREASLGEEYSDKTAVFKSTSGAITIPAFLGGYPVTAIGDHAFEGRSGLTSMTIPYSVTSIGSYAFLGCKGLTSVNIPNPSTKIGSSWDGDLGVPTSGPGAKENKASQQTDQAHRELSQNEQAQALAKLLLVLAAMRANQSPPAQWQRNGGNGNAGQQTGGLFPDVGGGGGQQERGRQTWQQGGQSVPALLMTCPVCGGSGRTQNADWERPRPCWKCSGTGAVPDPRYQ